MLRLIWIVSIHIRHFMRRYMPTNILLNAIRTRRGLKWGVPAMLLGAAYIFTAAMCITLIEHGWSQWLYLAFVLLLWNGLKFILMGPISLTLWVRVRIQEAAAKRRTHREQAEQMDATAYATAEVG